MPRRKDESVSINPFGAFGVDLQEVTPKNMGHRGASKRKSGVTGIRLLNGIDGQGSNGINGKSIEICGLKFFHADFLSKRRQACTKETGDLFIVRKSRLFGHATHLLAP